MAGGAELVTKLNSLEIENKNLKKGEQLISKILIMSAFVSIEVRS